MPCRLHILNCLKNMCKMTTRQVEKSPNDPRSYRAISLPSGMKVGAYYNMSSRAVGPYRR